MRKFTTVHGHYEVETGRIQHAVRYSPRTFYKLVKAAENDDVSVSAKVSEIVEKYLGVK